MQACVEKPELRSVVGAFDRGAVGVCGVCLARQAAQQIGADRVVVLVAIQVEFVDEVEGGCRALDLGESDGSG